MSQLLLPFALVISHFLLINHATAAHTIDTPAHANSALLSIKTLTGSLSDSSPVKYAIITGSYTVQVIIPSKTVCRQKVNTFFIVTIPGTLLNQPIVQPEEITVPTSTTIAEGTNINIKGIYAGGSDELELLLKTPGRLTNSSGLNSLSGTAVMRACLSLMQVNPFFCW